MGGPFALYLREQRRNRGREKMSRGMPIQLERFGRLVGDDLDGRVVGERIGEVHHLVIDKGGQRRVCQTGRDCFGDCLDGGPGLDLFRRAVR